MLSAITTAEAQITGHYVNMTVDGAVTNVVPIHALTNSTTPVNIVPVATPGFVNVLKNLQITNTDTTVMTVIVEQANGISTMIMSESNIDVAQSILFNGDGDLYLIPPAAGGGGSGTVTSVHGTGTVSGITLTGTVTTAGNLTLGGTLAVTPSNFASQTANTFLAAPNGSAGVPTFRTIVDADAPTLQPTSGKDASNGYAGLTLFKLNLKNAANTFTNFFTNATTASRTWTMQDRDYTVAGLDDIQPNPEYTEYKFSTNTADSDPGTGKVKINAATRAAATFVYINQFNNSGTDISVGLLKLAVNDTVYMQDASNSASSVRYKVSSTVVQSGSYFKIPVTVDIAATGAEIANNSVTVLAFRISALGGGLGYTAENVANKDASNGYAGLTLFKLNMRNVANTFTSFFTNTNTAARTYTLPDKDGTVAMLSDSIIAQTVFAPTGAMATGTTIIPLDNTIPQNTEGTQFMTATITPTSATSKLCITVKMDLANSAGVVMIGALFRDATANAIVTTWESIAAGQATSLILYTEVTSGSTSATTFRAVAGGHAAGTTTFNGSASAAFFGGTMNSFIKIQERLS